MKPRNTIALASRITEAAHRFIIDALEHQGVQGIVPSHGSILYVLYKHQRITMKALANAIHRSKPTVTVLVNKLESLGYVHKERCAKDSRITYVCLTQQGVAFQKDFEAVSVALNAKVFRGISEADIDTLEPILEAMLHNLLSSPSTDTSKELS